MSRFRFRLESVLRLRKAREKDAMVDVGRAQRRVAEEEESLQSLHCQRALAWQELHADLPAGEGRGSSTGLLLHHIGCLDAATLCTKNRLRELEDAVAVARAFAEERRKEAAAVEKLRERASEEYDVEERRMEGRLMDEVATSRHLCTVPPGEDK